MENTKVFISSVIENYKDRRDAAEEAILELNIDQSFNFEAIRIESKKYPAVNKTPQKACLDGVKECDIYLGIFPRNKSSSPTEEEFGQAGNEKKCRFVFIENTQDIDPIQSEFLKEFKGWESGHFYNEFESGNVDQLKHMVYRALRNFMKANFEECRLNYLNTILKQYKQINRPWECSLPVSEIVQLELILIEEKQEEKELSTKYDEIERHLENLPKSLLFSDVIQENLRLLIIGEPGAGKSTSLQWITYSYAEQILNSTQKKLPVPIYLELWSYDDSLLELIMDAFSEKGITCDEETITDWIKKGKLDFSSKAFFLLAGNSEKVFGEIIKKGLDRLDAYVQTEMNKHSIANSGVVEYGGGYYIHLTTECAFDEKDAKLDKMLPEVLIYAMQKSYPRAGDIFTLYHKYDEKNKRVEFSSCIPVKERVNPDGDIALAFMESGRYHKTTLQGAYKYLNEAWEKAFEFAKADAVIVLENGKPFEVYTKGHTDSENPADWVTEIYLPIE